VKTLLSLLITFFTMTVWACPNCHDTVGKVSGPPWTLIIVGVFILSTYIPFYILFRAAKKFDPHNSEVN